MDANNDNNENAHEGVERQTLWEISKEELREDRREIRLLKIAVCVLVLVVTVLALTTFVCWELMVLVYAPLAETVLREHSSTFQPKGLQTDYGVLLLSDIDSCTHKEVELQAGGNSLEVVRAVLSSGEVVTTFMNESISVNHSGISPGSNEVRAYSNLTYESYVTGPVGTMFTVNVTMLDKNGIEHIVSSRLYTIDNGTGVFVSFKSNRSGTFEVRYNVSQGATVHQEGHLSYATIDTDHYNNETFSRGCTIDNNGPTHCTIPISFEVANFFNGKCKKYHVIVIIADMEERLLSAIAAGRHSAYAIVVGVIGVVLGLLISSPCCIIAGCCFYRKKVNNPRINQA